MAEENRVLQEYVSHLETAHQDLTGELQEWQRRWQVVADNNIKLTHALVTTLSSQAGTLSGQLNLDQMRELAQLVCFFLGSGGGLRARSRAHAHACTHADCPAGDCALELHTRPIAHAGTCRRHGCCYSTRSVV